MSAGLWIVVGLATLVVLVPGAAKLYARWQRRSLEQEFQRLERGVKAGDKSVVAELLNRSDSEFGRFALRLPLKQCAQLILLRTQAQKNRELTEVPQLFREKQAVWSDEAASPTDRLEAVCSYLKRRNEYNDANAREVEDTSVEELGELSCRLFNGLQDEVIGRGEAASEQQVRAIYHLYAKWSSLGVLNFCGAWANVVAKRVVQPTVELFGYGKNFTPDPKTVLPLAKKALKGQDVVGIMLALACYWESEECRAAIDEQTYAQLAQAAADHRSFRYYPYVK